MQSSPGKNDLFNVGAWEMLAYKLARNCGITVAESKIQRFTTDHHTFLVNRFDRTKKGERLHFSSAMTQLGYTDEANASAGVSYLDLVEFLMNHGARPAEDLKELWRRIVFNIAISNCDDHLRNHGFMLSQKGWVLSPAYDLNPDEHGSGLSLNIDELNNALSFELVLKVAPYFRLDEGEAEKSLNQIIARVKRWQTVADTLGISRNEQEQKATAFRF